MGDIAATVHEYADLASDLKANLGEFAGEFLVDDAIDWKANIINAIRDLEEDGEKLVWNSEKKSQSKSAADKLIALHLGRKFPNPSCVFSPSPFVPFECVV